MTAAAGGLGREIRELADELADGGWDRLRGLCLLHAATRAARDCGAAGWVEAAGRAESLAGILGEFVKELSPRADRIAAALEWARALAGLIETAPRGGKSRLDETLPERPAEWTMVLAGDVDGAQHHVAAELGAKGFRVAAAADAGEVAALCQTGRAVVLTTVSWLIANARALAMAMPRPPGAEGGVPTAAMADVGDFRAHVRARQAGARLIFDAPLDVRRLLGELAGLAWMPAVPYRALLVDDDAAALAVHSAMLREAGFAVTATDDPVAAHEFALELAPEVCVLDVEMPACHGPDLAALLRRSGRLARLPVIYLSSHADIAHQLAARAAGGDDYLVKPVAPALLVAAARTKAREFRAWTLAERQRRRTLRHLESLRQGIDAHAVVSVTDAAGAIVDVNDKFCEFSGYARPEVLGRNHRLLKSGRHPAGVYDEMWRTIASGRIWQKEMQSRNKGGQPVWALSTITPILGDDGRPERYVAIRADTTALRRAEERLLRQNRLLDLLRHAMEGFIVAGRDWSEIAACLLDGMLALTESVHGFIGEVRRDEDGTPCLRTHAAAWGEEARGPQGTAKAGAREFCSLAALFDAVHQAGEAVIANDPAADPRVGGLPPLHPPLENFLGVPIRYGDQLVGLIGLANRPGGYDASVVEFLGAFTASYAHLVEASRQRQFQQKMADELQRARNVAERADCAKGDFLVGWSRELRTPLNALLGHAQILEMDVRLDPEAREQVREIVAGGRQVAAMLEELRERIERDAPAAGGAAGGARDAVEKPPRRILVAEDNPANQAVLRMQLDALGFAADIAADGAQALEKWQAGGHDLILADRNMPRMDGLEMARAIRARERDGGGHIPIIAITAVRHEEELAACRQAGMDDVLPKPIEIEDLRRLLERRLPRVLPFSPLAGGETASEPAQKRTAVLDLHYLTRIVGRIDAGGVRELVDLFTATAHGDLPSCRRYLAERNGRALGLAMHKLKSAAGAVGALRFAALAESLEAAAKAGRLEAAARLLSEVDNALADVEAAAARLAAVPALAFSGTAVPEPGAALPRRVLVVDDDPVARRQLAMLLAAMGAGDVVAADNGEAALAEIGRQGGAVDLLVTDLNMPGMDGVEFLRHLADVGYRGCLILASGVEDRLLQSAAELARAKGMRLRGTLKKPVTRDALLRLMAESCEKPSADADDDPTGLAVAPKDILEGIRRDEFEIHFQPKADAASLRIVGVEALARWRRGDQSIPPDAFIGAAERHGLIGGLSEVLIVKALAGGARLAEAGFPLFVAVNLSAGWLADIRLPEFILASAQAAGFPADRLILEITETGAMADVQTALDVLARLRLKGFKLSIDDFGVGYSSMEQLQRFPFGELKLDRGFVRGAAEKQDARAILASSIEMAMKLNLSTVAEGVETQAELDLLRGLGCDLIQGWFVAKAMPVEELVDWLRARSQP